MNRIFFVPILILAGIVVTISAAAAQTPNAQPAAAPERIAVGDLKKKLDSGEKLLLIDVREDWELKADGAIAGAIHIPVAELDARMKDIPKDVQLIFY
ncbi:MAG: hypothetical protein HYX73_08465 [Acidobacteria bacterium]|nr:hypothetical protein [Acidobacteriota bacterium]